MKVRKSNMKRPVLVILAAGLGSRYGGLKQIEPIGEYGELLIDYSLFDAKRAGFEDVVFIIKKEIEADFKERIGNRMHKYFNVTYAYQSLDKLPAGYCRPAGRTKPYGTTHALLCAEQEIGYAPFCVINSDDYYGPQAYRVIYRYLVTAVQGEHAMVGYMLGNTLTDNGSVARGVCRAENGYLTGIVERTKIIKTETGAAFTLDGEHYTDIDPKSLVSLNFWGFMPDVFRSFKEDFLRFLNNEFVSDPLKGECFVPNTVGAMLEAKAGTVRVLTSHDSWHGVTYKEDKPRVVEALRELTDIGVYGSPLWK